MKILWLVVPALLLLSTPAMAVEYKGHSIDGQKLPATTRLEAFSDGVFALAKRL